MKFEATTSEASLMAFMPLVRDAFGGANVFLELDFRLRGFNFSLPSFEGSWLYWNMNFSKFDGYEVLVESK